MSDGDAPIRVVLVDDHALCRSGLSDLLTHRGGMQVMAALADPDQLILALREHTPDLVVLDLRMPSTDGLSLLRRIRTEGIGTPALILTMSDSETDLSAALRAGVRGYLLKDAPSEQLASALRQVMRGVRVIDPQLAVAAWGEEDPLTERERAVLRLAGEGATSAQIAERLHLSQGTVRNYLSEAIGKLGAANRIEAFRTARQKGWL